MGLILPSGCNDSPTPEPEPPVVPENPDTPSWGELEIPFISERPTEYTGFENLPCDTMLQGMLAGFGQLIPRPVIEIYDHALDVAGEPTPTRKFDDEIFFEHEGKEYRIGDIFPFCYRGEIGHMETPGIGAGEYEIPGICLGFIQSLTDEHITLRWPAKDLTVYIRIYKDGKKVSLPPNWHGHEFSERDGGYATWGGMFVNGVGTPHLGIHVLRDGSVKLVRQDSRVWPY